MEITGGLETLGRRGGISTQGVFGGGYYGF